MSDQPYTEADIKALTLHAFGMSIALGVGDVVSSRERVIKILDWLAAAGRLLPGSARFPLSCDCPTRCSSRMSDGIVVLQCQRPVHADDEHRTIHDNWRSGDDRELRSTDE